MAKKTVDDAGLKYMKELGLKPAKNINTCKQVLSQVVDQETIDLLGMTLIARDHGTTQSDDEAFYDFKNKTFDFSLTLSGTFDGDYIRKAGNWFVKHQELLRGEILDIGCGCGILTCFLARLVPGCHVTAIDRNEKAIAHARMLADRLAVHNVDFVHASSGEFARQASGSGMRFDTVLSCRISQENLGGYRQSPAGKLFCEEGREWAQALGEYAGHIDTLLKEDGQLVCILLADMDPHLYGWLQAMHGLGIVMQQNEALACTQLDQPYPHQILTFIRMPHSRDSFDDPTASSTAGNVGAHATCLPPHIPGEVAFLQVLASRTDMNQPEYTGYTAVVMEDLRRGEFIAGFTAATPDGSERYRLSLWKHCDDPEAIVCFKDSNGAAVVRFFDAKVTEAALRQQQSIMGTLRARFFEVQPMAAPSEKESDLERAVEWIEAHQ